MLELSLVIPEPDCMSSVTRFFNQNILNEMPKIVIQVDRSAHTRSKTQVERKDHPTNDSKQEEGTDRSRGTTPPKSATKYEPRSSISRVRRSTVKLADRKFFTVQEDSTILSYLKEHKDSLNSRAIAESLSKKMKHSLESIRDRIKRFLSKLRPLDEQYIATEAKVNSFSNFYILAMFLTNRPTLATTFTSPRTQTRRSAPLPISLLLYLRSPAAL